MEVPHATVAGRYRLVEQIGAGGMGVVWRAEDERLHRPVAVKLLRPPLGLSEDEAELATQRAMREARITARLHHPHAVAVFDVVEHEGRPGLVMQYVPSVPLSTVLREGGPLSVVEGVRLGAEVASALAAAHRLDIVHRDVKPGNILVAEDGSAMLSDFGISRVLGDATLTVTGMVHGTPAYLAPEVARGASSDAATDVYSLGATLYAALEGSPPFGSDPNPIVLLHRVASGEFPPPQRSGPLGPLLLRMLALDPAARPTMAGVAAELAALGVAIAQCGAPTRPLPGSAPAPAPAQQPPQTARTPLLPAAPVAAAPPATPTAHADQTSVRPAAPPPTHPPAEPGSPRRRGRMVAPVVVVLVLLAALGVLFLGDRLGSRSGADPASAGPVSSAPAPSSVSTQNSASASASAPSSPSETASAPPTPSAGPTSPSSTPTSASPSTPSGGAQLVQAVTGYYGLLPKNTEAGWAQLTSRYQRSSGGRAGYDRFWADFSRVSTSKVAASGSNRVEATISYVYTDGRTLSERRSFALVDDGGVLKIDASSLV